MASTRAILLAVASTIALLASIAPLTTAQTLHTHMSPEELRRVFHVEEHDQVPQYEIVHVHSSARRDEPLDIDEAENSDSADSGDSGEQSADSGGHSDDTSAGGNPVPIKHLKMSAFGQDLKLKMKKATGLFKGDKVKMWSVQKNVTEPHQVEYMEEQDDGEDIGEIYQDEENLAALLLQTEKDGTLAVEGTIGHELVVKPIPHSLRRHLPVDADVATPADDEMFLDQDGEDVGEDVSIDTGKPLMRSKRAAGAVRTQQHIVFKRSVRQGQDDLSDYAFMEVDHMSKKHRTKRSITKREAPYVIYPEILVIVDYDGYRLHGGDNVQIKRYFVSFWNGVDLRYKLLKGPKIRISIAGIIISRGRDATPYLERNRVGRDAIDSAAALTDMGKYLFRERRLPVYDIAVAVTKLDMCRRQYANDACNRGTAGFAYVGGACVVNKRLEKVNSVAIIEDTGGFSGIIVGAHEVGHLLGAVHDGSPPPSYLGGPGAEKCRWEDGFIMSDLRHTDKGFKWSSCSVTSFHHFLNGDTATCLYNSPHEDESLPRVLPGKLLTLDAQCRKDRGTSACFKDDRVCAQLFCFDAGSGYCVAYRPAAEGSSCGDGQYCINGKCTTEHENIIPDYSSNTPTYIRRSDDAETSATQARPSYAALANATTQRYEWNEPKTTKEVTTTTSTTQAPSPQKYSFKVNFYPATKNPYSYYSKEATTKTAYPYNKETTTKSPYSYSYSKETVPTKSPYSYPYSKETVPTKAPYTYTYSKESTTKSPYSYKNDVFTTSTTTLSPFYEKYKNYNSATTKSPYNYYNYKVSTTKNPYDFSNFHQTHVRNLQPIKTPSAEHKQAAASSPEVRYETSPTTPKPTTENPYLKYFKDLTSTTKKPTYNHYNQYYGSSSTGSPYALSYSKPTPKPYSYDPYALTTTTKKSAYFKTSATENVETIVPFANAGTMPVDDTECVDTAANIAGSMTCAEFLRSYGYQYCHSRYMLRNCCASHRQLCASPAS